LFLNVCPFDKASKDFISKRNGFSTNGESESTNEAFFGIEGQSFSDILPRRGVKGFHKGGGKALMQPG